jgi:hypothetical protein
MEFLAIMFLGMLVAVWLVARSRPIRPTQKPPGNHALNSPPLQISTTKPETWQWRPINSGEYWAALDLHTSDPINHPLPLPPPRQD